MESVKGQQIEQFIRQEAETAGYIIVDLTISGGRNLNLEVILDKEGGIKLDECSSFNRKIVFWIEKNGLNAGNFKVDVCSPGLDRELKSESSFQWGKGKRVKVVASEDVNGSTVICGKLLEREPNGDILIAVENGSSVRVQKSKINKVKLVPEI